MKEHDRLYIYLNSSSMLSPVRFYRCIIGKWKHDTIFELI